MRSHTWPNWMKFSMGPPKGITRVITEGFLDIRSMGPDMGYTVLPVVWAVIRLVLHFQNDPKSAF